MSEAQEQQQLPVAEIAGQAKHFKTMFGGPAAIMDFETGILLTPEGLKAMALATDKAGLILLDYPKSAFDKYNVTQEVTFAVQAEDVVTVLKRASDNKTAVVMKVDFEKSLLTFNFDKKTFKCKMVVQKTEIKPVTLPPTAKIVTSFAQWDDLLGDLQLDGKGSKDVAKVIIQVQDGKAKFYNESKKGTEYETIKENTAAEPDKKPAPDAWEVSGQSVPTEFNVEKLAKISKALALTTEKITINVASDDALRLDFDEGYLTYWLGAIKARP